MKRPVGRPGRRAGGEDPSDGSGPVPVPAPIPAPIPAGAPNRPPLAPPPARIAGYRILEPLGRGSMGAVYRAVQESLDRVVAIKILTKEMGEKPGYARRFEREALASAKLNHPHIVAALDVGEEDGHRYLVMEFVPGRNVSQILSAGPLEPRKAVAIVLQVARALEHAHRHGIVHRDIKPANILVTPEGVAKLGDLGLAKNMDADASQTEEGIAMGTPFYVSPEQARGERRVDIRTDLYSLGATLYHMVTGRVPFPGPNPAVVMTRHLNDPPEPADDVNPAVGRGIAQILDKMLSKAREDRHQSPTELIADLVAWLEGRYVVQTRIEIKPRRRRRFR